MLDTNKLGQNVHAIIAHALSAAVANLKSGAYFDALHFADWIMTSERPITFALTPVQTPLLVALTDLNSLADADDDSVRHIDPEACGMWHVGEDHFATTVTSTTFKHAVTLAVADLSEELAHDVIAESDTIFAQITRAAIVVEHLDFRLVYLHEVLREKVSFAVQMIVNAYRTNNLPLDQFGYELARKLIIEPQSLKAIWGEDGLRIKVDPRRMTTGVSANLAKRGINPKRLVEDHGFTHDANLVCISTPFDPSVLAELAIRKLEEADVMLDSFDVAKLTGYLEATRPDDALQAHNPVHIGGKAGAFALVSDTPGR